LVADGAWGTELQARGLDAGDCPDVWNLKHPDRVLEVAAAYVAAGSQVILTNTFRSNRVTLAGHGLADQTVAINRAGARLSLEAARGRALVFASIGPSGKMLLTGETTEEQLFSAFQEQAGALASAGVDALLVETMSDIEEARIALRAARTTGLPVIVSFAFDTGKNKDRTMMGSTPEQVAVAMAEAGADGVGANCGVGISAAVTLCTRLRAACGLPIWVKPNAGLPEMVEGVVTYRTGAEEFAARAPELIAAGASFVGGCCGSDPGFIRAVAAGLAS
jgi:5-methyltetrahydrofolate--homocysteine methyltransferase